MKISLVVNFKKDKALDTALQLIEELQGYNVDVLCDDDTAKKLNCDKITVDQNYMENCDICVILGGDGTIIHTAKKAAQLSIPVLGINLGRIGYLATVKATEIEKIRTIISGEYNIEERMMLEITKESKEGTTQYIAFNDAVITKGTLSRMLDIETSVDGHKINYRSDGLIVATPTGSTAYSLSAGGPVIDPRVQDVLITPICPYSCFDRPMIIPANAKVSVSVDVSGNKEAYLTLDGEVAVKIEHDDKILISRANSVVKLISLKSRPGYFSLGSNLK